ncbi:glycerol-3-phosphate dehydrogenase (NAD(P)+) [Limimonas halophila]|uniref:Glycerol-3-phosphate dehydrogenase [NAD(P)+] n=1 Tax=Limimonas halophila TaxID=1082479 RepID=A0A1G7T5S1_9PROT|nr:NAD(P)H-dependent glycerol-3-phosphate dehydrogenase [Limimonas halophila]SDG30374.1 glycerol-3-phosphate dehydrogenase (NAD(P)+) [Limimonas halophila]
MERVSIIGAGAWGTALAQAARRAGCEVTLWAHNPEVAETLAVHQENRHYLPGIPLDPAIRPTADLTHAAEAGDVLVLATPAQHLRTIAERLHPVTGAEVPAVIAAKGLERGSSALMSAVLAEALPGRPAAVLSGPTFAGEVARGLPAAATLAAEDTEGAAALVETLGSRAFRLYASTDVVGAQIGGAVKNVVAIAAGIVAGRGLGENARAALITRGLAEIGRLAVARGAHAETLSGLSGLGDLTLTCTGIASRNYTLGVALGEGHALADVLAARRSVTEGIHTAKAVTALAERAGVDMPIAAGVDAVVNHDAALDDTIDALLARPFRSESR